MIYLSVPQPGVPGNNVRPFLSIVKGELTTSRDVSTGLDNNVYCTIMCVWLRNTVRAFSAVVEETP